MAGVGDSVQSRPTEMRNVRTTARPVEAGLYRDDFR